MGESLRPAGEVARAAAAGASTRRPARRPGRSAADRRPTHPPAPGDAPRHDLRAIDQTRRRHPGVQSGLPTRSAVGSAEPPHPRGVRVVLRDERTRPVPARQPGPSTRPGRGRGVSTPGCHTGSAGSSRSLPSCSPSSESKENERTSPCPTADRTGKPDAASTRGGDELTHPGVEASRSEEVPLRTAGVTARGLAEPPVHGLHGQGCSRQLRATDVAVTGNHHLRALGGQTLGKWRGSCSAVWPTPARRSCRIAIAESRSTTGTQRATKPT